MKTKNTMNFCTSEMNQFEAVLKYPMFFLGLAGIFSREVSSDYQTTNKTLDNFSKSITRRMWEFFKHIYRAMMGAFNLVCFAKTVAMIVEFDTLDKASVEETIAVPFCSLVWISCTFVSYKHFPSMSTAFREYEMKFGYAHDIARSCRQAKIVSLVVIVLHICFKFTFAIVHIFLLNDSVGYTYPIELEGEARLLACTAVTLVYFFMELTPYYLLVQYVFVVHILTAEFRGTRDEMSALFISLSDFEERFALIR